MEKWLEFRVEEDCPHELDVYNGCPLCRENDLECEISALDLIISRHDSEVAMWKKGFHGLELELAELNMDFEDYIVKREVEIAAHKTNMVWALKMLHDQEKGNPVYEEMCGKYFCKGKEG